MNSKNWILLKELVKTDFKLRYQGSLMGHLWSILKPLMLFSVMYLVFVRFLGLGRDMPHFAVALLLGMVIWNFFAETTSMGLTSIVGRGDLLRKLSFPKEIIVLSVAVSAFINFLINLLVVLFFAVLNQVEISKYAIIAPLYIIPIFAFSLGIAFILATLFVYFRDIAPVWEVVMQAGMYATPIIYSLSMIHNNRIIAVMMLNPLATIIQDLRHILIYPGNQVITEFINNKWIVAIPYVLPFIVLVFGYTIFKKYADKFAEII
ncbi:ABC transporter permease [Lactococcus piscium]|uniref:Transport permease protein n=1 Tax=Pseudolactococcus paracarnosus TaxID=2749962 RepID=A0A7L4WF67_9LACT|nr:ABC transporter permease [Lactococcus paracarnosus]SPC36894.1 Rhamnose-containing polysacharide translocation permease [Lactococcus piscium]MCJ1976868.1 ABC transporter permease [Lactococcus paracarnosus]MCJ1982746.1 ABC transporter permease [Lactococcus paracarnosus]MCJ1994867.1 ABC transporter permease [Lactococcus paracarnosus]QDJ28877.1 glycosyl transferase family 9 [Lactococcus paracarnosus]